jgi:GNAT superfamily N-acetyltransferase
VEGVRRASPGDADRLASLAAAARAELVSRRGGDLLVAAHPAPSADALVAEMGDPGRLVLAGTLDGYPVGYLRAHVEALADGRRLGVIEEVYVEPDARGVGVGEALVAAALAWCRGHDCAGVDAPALPGDREAKNFFETHGFSARLLVMHRAVGDAT